MRRALAALLCVIGLGADAAEGAQGTGETASAAVAREGELAARALALENERLRAEVAKLEEQVARLTVSLAESLAEMDLARVREDQALAGPARSVDRGNRAMEVGVLEVNPELRLAVLDAGRKDGVTPGTAYAVLREGRVVARLRVVDVRDRISGAALEGGAGSLPQRGDRAVLGR